MSVSVLTLVEGGKQEQEGPHPPQSRDLQDSTDKVATEMPTQTPPRLSPWVSDLSQLQQQHRSSSGHCDLSTEALTRVPLKPREAGIGVARSFNPCNRKQRQVDLHGFKTSLVYMLSSRTARATK